MPVWAARAVVDNVINMDGLIQARSAVESNGEIILSGGDEGTVRVSGTLDASGQDTGLSGGTVHVLGAYVGVFDYAKIDVSVDAGGGTALIGGNYNGHGPVRDAKRPANGAN